MNESLVDVVRVRQPSKGNPDASNGNGRLLGILRCLGCWGAEGWGLFPGALGFFPLRNSRGLCHAVQRSAEVFNVWMRVRGGFDAILRRTPQAEYVRCTTSSIARAPFSGLRSSAQPGDYADVTVQSR
jgi:hypothetical protein